MLLKTCLVRDVITPSRAHATDAGIDFYIPKMDDQFREDLLNNPANSNVKLVDGKRAFVIPQGENACIPSGVKIEIPYGYMGLFLNKSGFASKKDGLIGAQVIDCGYKGEVHIDIHNVGSRDIEINEGDKVAQLIITPVLCCDITEVSEDQLYDWMEMSSSRGNGGFGSTDKK